MRVAVLSSEAVPFSKTGGLADVAGALPKALQNNGVDAFLITPLYSQTNVRDIAGQIFDNLQVEWRGANYSCGVYYSESAGARTFLIDAPEMFHRSSIYGFQEDYLRFAFFSKAALALLPRLGNAPDIIHLNDWHTGFAAVEVASRRRFDDFFRRVKTVFSIHNLAYQGNFDAGELWKLGCGEDWQRNAFLLDGAASALKAGLETADALTTVSRRYALEIQTPEQGGGLDWLLRRRSANLFGITNGIDEEIWNPSADKYLPAHFHAGDLTGKAMCKNALQRRFMLPESNSRPVFGWISRLTEQKGFSLLQEIIGELLFTTGASFVALGSGSREYEDFLQKLRDTFPFQVGIFKGYNEELAHLIEAGADIFLMPSLFEPCGLNQMYSLRYGTIPVVRAVGGLDDTIKEFDRLRGTGNGFKFAEFSAQAFSEKIYEALFTYADQNAWRKIQWNAMTVDNSWRSAAQNYINLYRMISV